MKEKNVLSTPEKKTIKLGGKNYKLSPLNLNVLADIEEAFDCGFDVVAELLEKKPASSMRKLAFVLLKEQYPDITLTKIGELINMSNLAEVSETLAKVLAGD